MQEAPMQRQMMRPKARAPRMLAADRRRMAAAQRGLGAGQQPNTGPTLQQLADGLAQRRAAAGLSPERAYDRAVMARQQPYRGRLTQQQLADQLAQRGAAAGMRQRQYGQLDALPEQSDPGGYDRAQPMSDYVDAGIDSGYKHGGPSRPLSLEEKLAMVVMDHEAQQFDDGGSALQNVRDEEGRVINIQDDAADELRRVEERTPYDAQERKDKSAQLARIGAREKDAHEELHRDRDEAVMLEAQEGGSKKDWIKNAIKKPGALRKYTDTAAGKSIPKGELNKLAAGKPATKGGPKPSAKTVKRAGLAKTLGKMNTKKAATGGSMKKQGYDDRLDESLGMSNGKNSQSMKARRNESKGMEKAMGKRAYSRVGTMDKAQGGSTRQGYDDRDDESLSARHGKKSQSMKDRRDESKGEEKSMGRKAYADVGTMDKGSKLAAVNRSTALKGFKQMGVMKRI